MSQERGPGSSAGMENLKGIGIVIRSASLGAIATYASAAFFGDGPTLAVVLTLLFYGLASSSSIIEALLPTFVFSLCGYAALQFFPQFIPFAGALSGMALMSAYATYKQEKKERKENGSEF